MTAIEASDWTVSAFPTRRRAGATQKALSVMPRLAQDRRPSRVSLDEECEAYGGAAGTRQAWNEALTDRIVDDHEDDGDGGRRRQYRDPAAGLSAIEHG
jgi:hypothetical protein